MSNCCGCRLSVGRGSNLRPRGRQPKIALFRYVALAVPAWISVTVSAGLVKSQAKA